VPRADTAWFKRHPFYSSLVALQHGHGLSASRVAAARRDVRSMNIGWVLVWQASPQTIQYLKRTGFVFDYRADGVAVYRPSWK